MGNQINNPYNNLSEYDIIYKIRGCAFNVRQAFGRFLHERPYQMAMELVLKKAGFNVCREAPVHVIYDGVDCGRGFSVDILLLPNIVIELKATPEMYTEQFAQLRNYMNLLHSPLGMLINFGINDFKDGIHIMRAKPSQWSNSKAHAII